MALPPSNALQPPADRPGASPVSSVLSFRQQRRMPRFSGPTKVLVVQREDDDLSSRLDWANVHALTARGERDNVGAIQTLQQIRVTPTKSSELLTEVDVREQFYRKKHILAWYAAVSMPHSKKTPWETQIPVSGTRFLKKKPTKCYRMGRYIIKLFRCGAKKIFVQDVVTQRSIDEFNKKYYQLKDMEAPLSTQIGHSLWFAHQYKIQENNLLKSKDEMSE